MLYQLSDTRPHDGKGRKRKRKRERNKGGGGGERGMAKIRE